MDRSLVILLLAFAFTARAEYVCTNFDGVVISVANRTDPALNYAAGHITTTAAPYVPADQAQDIAALLESARTNLVRLSTQSTTAAAQSNQIEQLRRALLIITDTIKGN